MSGEPSDELTRLWKRVSEELRAGVPATTFRLWIEPLRAVSVQGSTLYLSAPETVRSWVERRYRGAIADALRRHSAGLEDVSLIGEREGGERGSGAAALRSLALDPGHSFGRFVIGPGNRLAHAAALAVAELPGDAYNPLFLHGPPGLGKTHLLGAVAAYMREHHPSLTVHYTTAERFTTEFVGALRHHGPERFKNRYRQLDALLIDDVQVLEGKERTQEEFVHTFNALHGAGKQIVLSSDRPPQALSRLEERLRDRFEWGLSVGIDPPDLRTRLALVWRLAADGAGEPLAPDALREIAARVPANVRLLEGAMTRVLAFASMLGEPVHSSLVHRALAPAGQPEPPAGAPPSIEAVQEAVCSVLGLSREDLLSPRRAPRVARARQLAMYVAREQTRHSLSEIARRFDRDHTTVLHAVRTVAQRLEPGSETSATLLKVRAQLGDSFLPPTPEAGPSPASPP